MLVRQAPGCSIAPSSAGDRTARKNERAAAFAQILRNCRLWAPARPIRPARARVWRTAKTSTWHSRHSGGQFTESACPCHQTVAVTLGSTCRSVRDQSALRALSAARRAKPRDAWLCHGQAAATLPHVVVRRRAAILRIRFRNHQSAQSGCRSCGKYGLRMQSSICNDFS